MLILVSFPKGNNVGKGNLVFRLPERVSWLIAGCQPHVFMALGLGDARIRLLRNALLTLYAGKLA